MTVALLFSACATYQGSPRFRRAAKSATSDPGATCASSSRQRGIEMGRNWSPSAPS